MKYNKYFLKISSFRVPTIPENLKSKKLVLFIGMSTWLMSGNKFYQLFICILVVMVDKKSQEPDFPFSLGPLCPLFLQGPCHRGGRAPWPPLFFLRKIFLLCIYWNFHHNKWSVHIMVAVRLGKFAGIWP